MNRNLLLLLGGGAILLWYLDSQKKTPTTTSGTGAGTGAPAGAPTGAAPASPAPPPAPTPAPVPVAAPFAQTLQRVKDAINSSGVSTTYIYGLQSPDVWNWYAMQAIPNWTAPAPESLYPGTPDAHRPVTFTDWWAKVQTFLPTGLSGFAPRSPLFSQLYGGWMA